jgi:two-component system chemotaxis response regulator CheB
MYRIVVFAGSAGSYEPLRQFIAALPVPCAAAVFIVMHIGSNKSSLPSLFHRAGGPPAEFAQDGLLIEADHIYVAPPDNHVTLDKTHMHLSQEAKEHYTRPAADPLFISAAQSHGEFVIGVVLSGGGSDGAIGLREIKKHGGLAFVQDPMEAAYPFMPYAAIAASHPDAVLPIKEIVRRVSELCVTDQKSFD